MEYVMQALIFLALLTSQVASAQVPGPSSLPPAEKPKLAVPYVGPTPCLPVLEVRPTDTDALGWVQPSQNVKWHGTPLRWSLGIAGGRLAYYCTEVGTARQVRVEFVSTIDDLPNVGGRLRTILRAADPLVSLQTAPQRITVLPISDPRFAAIQGVQ